MGSSPDPASLAPYAADLDALAQRESELEPLDRHQLRRASRSLIVAARAGRPPDELLVDLFSLVREISRRMLGQRPFDVQMAAGIALHRGKLVQMQTGEGKTLAAVAPVALNALTGRGVHVLTFNDYLARRDATWMGPVYRCLGLTVGCVQEAMPPAERRRNYACDVVYLTAKEAGFDHLRDQLCLRRDEQVHRPFHMAVVDEADSILIDEARIPLVIAGVLDESAPDPARLARVVRQLVPEVDFDIDPGLRQIALTPHGLERAEALLGSGNLHTAANVSLLAAVRNALHAAFLLRRDVDYIVRNGSIELVDELTGRVADNRLWPDGLQAAVEAKEGLAQRPEGRILGSITLQHFLRGYPRLAGMTATAAPAAEELAELYDLEVVDIPTHRPCVRSDLPDRIFADRDSKQRAVIAEIRAAQSAGRPVLVGTASVEESERLADELGSAGVFCRVLNAKNDEEEAAIVAEAGAPGAVTISTNMAGRGTDIRLGGRDQAHRDRVLELGGLFVIGTHRHESRRIDDQLRGRAGRQGDPGTSRFFISLQDELLRRHGIEQLIPRALTRAGSVEALDHPIIRREVSRSQRMAEGQRLDQRKRLWAYSELIEGQRQFIQRWRQQVLENRAELQVLGERCPRRHRQLATVLGAERLRRIEQRLTLHAIDRCWSDYLAEIQSLRDSIHLVLLDGRSPFAEFSRSAVAAFHILLERIDDTTVELFQAIEITPDGVDWGSLRRRERSATWTYLVGDSGHCDNLLLDMANHPAIGLWGVLLLWPLLFVWGLYQRRLRRQQQALLG